MKKFISIVIPVSDDYIIDEHLTKLAESSFVKEVVLLTAQRLKKASGYRQVISTNIFSCESIEKIATTVESQYTMFLFTEEIVKISEDKFFRIASLASHSNAGLLYFDHIENSTNKVIEHPTIDYQVGSIRDDFDFGPIWLVRSVLLKSYASCLDVSYKWAGFYDFRLLFQDTIIS